MHLRITWLILLIAVLPACKGKPQQFDTLYASTFGLGISFGQDAKAVHSALGEPTTTRELQGGANIEEYYLPAVDSAVSRDTPQLSLNFHDDQLIRVHNFYFPDQPDTPTPPFFIEPVAGVKLGNRRSAFIDALGQPAETLLGDTWHFDSADGRRITLRADFTEVVAVGDSLCTRLQVTLMPKVEQLKGEELEKSEAAKDQLLHPGAISDAGGE